MKSIEAEWNLKASNARLRKDEPPDAEAKIDGRTITIELKELVDPSLLQRTTHAKRSGGGLSAYGGPGFREAQWNLERSHREVGQRIVKYAEKYASKSEPRYDFLLLYTAEPWLLPEDVERWTSEPFLKAQSQFKEVHLLMEYDPKYRPYWPVFRVN